MYKKLLNKISNKKIKIGVVGLGYVGLPLAINFIKKKFDVIGIDNDKKKISLLKKNKSYISSIKKKDILYFKYFPNKITSNINIVKNLDIIFVCLPTPLKDNKKPNMTFVLNFFKKIKNNINKKLIVLESTVYPGASRYILKKMGIKINDIGKSIFFGYSPERENPGDKNFSYDKTPKVISGYTKECLNLTYKIYKPIVKKIYKAESLEVAEMSKLLENIYRSVNISLVNEIKIICNHFKNLNVYDVINAASSKNFGFKKFSPGPGIGGHCIPVDPYYLSWASKNRGYNPKFIDVAGKMNDLVTNWVTKNMVSFLTKKLRKKKFKILIVGVSYKANVDDDRESPSFKIMKILKKNNINFSYHDPFFPRLRSGRQNKFNLKSLALNKKNLLNFDASMIVTDHDNIDYNLLVKHSKFVIDTRGVMYKKKLNFDNVINL